MRNLRSIGCAALAAAAVLAGCGKSSSPKEQLQLSSFVAKAADTVCSALAKCGCSDSSAVTSCKQAFVSDMTDQLDYVLLEYPGQTIDPVAAQTCLDDTKTELSDCSLAPGTRPTMSVVVGFAGPRFDFPGCADVFKGVQASGERCHADVECATGLACDQGTLSCAAPAAVDASCETISCADTAWCNAGTCTAKLAAGATCTSETDNWGYDVCAAGMSCDYSSSLDRSICAAPVAIDGTCGDGNIPCVTGARCDGSNVCKALIADGADCTDGFECEHGWCNTQGKCEDPGICSLMGGPI
jgi:hypothetical protein